VFLRPDDPPGVVYEFFAPFAHVPGRYEWCRIRSPTHGVFDTFIVLGASTQVAATVYVNSALGLQFMAERYPECATIRVAPSGLALLESPDGRGLTGTLKADAGPVHAATMAIRAPGMALPKAVPYGGDGAPVWGSRWTCWGVDLALEATCDGSVLRADGKKETLRAAPAILTLGSFGRLAPRAAPQH
jgi:hypothetical protein